MKIDRELFFNLIRPIYGGHLTQAQVDVMDPALSAFEIAFGEHGERVSECLVDSWEFEASLRLSRAGSQVLVEREGLRTQAYQDTVGVWTIGVGHTAACGPPEPCAGMTITEAEAYAIFDEDNNAFEADVNRLVTVPLAQHEFDALVSFVFNVGTTAFADSTMLRLLNDGDKEGACAQFMEWDVPPEVMPRRRAEQAEFADAIYVAQIA